MVNYMQSDVWKYHENTQPIIGFPGHSAHRLVLKTQKASSIILPDKLAEDY